MFLPNTRLRQFTGEKAHFESHEKALLSGH
jgi:hypothetical protein